MSFDTAVVAGLVVACAGCLGAVFVSMVPYPMWAMTKACSAAEGISNEQCETWEVIIGFYCADAANPYANNMVMKNMRELAGPIDVLPGHVSNIRANNMVMKPDAEGRRRGQGCLQDLCRDRWKHLHALVISWPCYGFA